MRGVIHRPVTDTAGGMYDGDSGLTDTTTTVLLSAVVITGGSQE